MIIDLPNGEEYRVSARRFLEMSWTNAISHCSTLEWHSENMTLDEEQESELRAAARDDLAVDIGLVQTATELLLRARIAEVSPYLLLTPPREWPSGSTRDDVRFENFRTVDAVELVRIHDTVVDRSRRLSAQFVNHYNAQREARNALFHSTARSLVASAYNVVRNVLVCTHELVGPLSWVSMRRTAIQVLQARFFEHSGALTALSDELHTAIKELPPRDCRLYLGIDKKRRLYRCPTCLKDVSEVEADSGHYREGVAQLQSRDGACAKLNCIACGSEDIDIDRDVRCTCGGNVSYLDTDTRRCLSCCEWID